MAGDINTMTFVGLDAHKAIINTKGRDLGFRGSTKKMSEVDLMLIIPGWNKASDWEQANYRELVRAFHAVRAKKSADGIKLDYNDQSLKEMGLR